MSDDGALAEFIFAFGQIWSVSIEVAACEMTVIDAVFRGIVLRFASRSYVLVGAVFR